MIAGMSDIKNEETGEKLLAKRFEKISFVGNDVALAKYLNPSTLQVGKMSREYILLLNTIVAGVSADFGRKKGNRFFI